MNRKKLWKSQGSYKSFNTGKPMVLVMDEKTGATVLEPLKKTKVENEPIPGQQYALTGKTGDKCIANGNTWEESLISEKAKDIIRPEWDKMQEFLKEVNCPVCDKPFINGTCEDCDKLVANLK